MNTALLVLLGSTTTALVVLVLAGLAYRQYRSGSHTWQAVAWVERSEDGEISTTWVSESGEGPSYTEARRQMLEWFYRLEGVEIGLLNSSIDRGEWVTFRRNSVPGSGG